MSSPRPPALLLLVAFPCSLALTACAEKPATSGAATTTATAAATAPAAPTAPPAVSAETFLAGGEVKTTEGGIQYIDVAPGAGPPLASGTIAVLDYQAWLGDGKLFDDSTRRPGDFCYEVGGGKGITFFSEAVVGMQVGGTRRILVPADKGYGASGRPPLIPPNSTLLFEMKLRDTRPISVRPDLTGVTLTTNPSGLKWVDLAPGDGDPVVAGSTATVFYSGFLDDGTKFDSAFDRCAPFDVRNVGKAGVIAGWNEGLLGMKPGGRRVLVIPGDLAYGPKGRLPTIPPDATLTFDIEVLDVTAPPKPPEPMEFPNLATLTLTTSPSGLKWADIRVGSGAEIKRGNSADMHYSGWLENGTKFDASVDRGETFPVQNIGSAGVIAGWNEGLQGMKEGGRRVLVIPSSLGYGDAGYPPVIPSNATLVFMIDAVKVR